MLLVNQKSPLRGFFDLLKYQLWIRGPVVYAVKTLPLTSSEAGANPAGSTSRVSYNGNTPVFQTGARGSIPLTRS